MDGIVVVRRRLWRVVPHSREAIGGTLGPPGDGLKLAMIEATLANARLAIGERRNRPASGFSQGGPCQTSPVTQRLDRANRHGLVAGATGTGKTVTLQVLAQGLSDAGVPVFAADVKGDLSGVAATGAAQREDAGPRRRAWA